MPPAVVRKVEITLEMPDSSENETDSRLSDHYPVRNTGGQDGDPSGARKEEVERGMVWKDGNGRERKGDAGAGKDGELNNGFSGSSALNVELKESEKDVQKATDMEIDAEVQGRDEKCKSRGGRNLKRVQSSEDERDEETEDDFEHRNGAAAEVVSNQRAKQSHQQEQSDRTHQQQQQQQLQPQEQQPLPQNAPVATAGWESFLPQMQLRVLLAEDDDSTRHVVGALLRNCSYEVTSAANGMQAWEMLEDPNNHFDLVLTDVVMPCLSGVGLLTKIMSREAGKRVPVIMMSSHDSLDIVFRCLSKGAADFLVKPVRKNELKNLWQHVWRCQSSSGSGSGSGGSGSGTGKATQPKSRVGSGNNSGSNDGSEDGSSGLNVRGGSDNGSGTQTVAVHVQTREKQKRDREEGQATSLQKVSDEQMGQDLEMATRRPGNAELQQVQQSKQLNEKNDLDRGSPSSSDRNDADQIEEGYNSGAANSGGSAKAIDLIGGIACQNNEDTKEGDDSDAAEGSDRGASNSPVMNEKYASGSALPTLELSLKRCRAPGEEEADVEDRRIVRQSGGSAFSRYSTSGIIIQQHQPTGNPLGFGSYAMGASYGLGTGKTGQIHLATPLDRCGSSLGSGEASTPVANNPHPCQKSGTDMGSGVVGTSGQDGYGNSRQTKDESVSVSPVSGAGIPLSRPGVPPSGMLYEGVPAAYGPPMHPVFYSHPAAPPWAAGPSSSNRGEVFDHPPFRDHGPHIPHHRSHHHQPHHSAQHHHLHHHHSHVPQASMRAKPDDQTVTNQGPGAPRCGSSNVAGSAPDGNTGQSGSSNGYGSNGNGNGSVNGSASGSNNLSNQNGQSGVPLPASGNGGSGGNNGDSGSGNALTANAGIVDSEQNRFARREAALNKFRQKRKERCFEKKVRYQSRKRLAEQRPRVRDSRVAASVVITFKNRHTLPLLSWITTSSADHAVSSATDLSDFCQLNAVEGGRPKRPTHLKIFFLLTSILVRLHLLVNRESVAAANNHEDVHVMS
ncbi:hypothetical protein R1flu_009951 [Riccia fluitans]|uniref:Uncharacterized protein n=1 Tax=Riccia fluitans TaxID=41844 RepID=A0ABD1Z668_9MARC